MANDNALSYLEKLDSRSRGTAVLDALAEMVERAGLTVGDRLPPEISLAATLGVGRSTIREALNRWEGLGLINRRRGDGTYITAQVQSSQGVAPTMVRLEGEALLRLLEVRRTLEREVVRRAAIHATQAQRKRIAALCTALLAEVDAGRSWVEADVAFHGAIYESAANPMFGQILRSLGQAQQRSTGSPFGSDAFAPASFPLHQQLSDAVVAGNPDAAVDALDHMLDAVVDDIRRLIA